MAGLQAQGALLGITPNLSSAQLADFTDSNLQINYDKTTGKFTAISKVVPNTSNDYKSGSLSAGTHGNYNDTTGFSGSFSLTAYIQNYSGTWGVSSGSFEIDGDLPGVTTLSSDILLKGSLLTGPGSLGYGTSGQKEFDFLFSAVSGGNTEILQDFFGAGMTDGEMVMQAVTYSGPNFYEGDFLKSFANTGTGYEDTFVPEPSSFGIAFALAALSGVVFRIGKQGGKLTLKTT